MKLTRIIAITAAVMLVFAGCTSRNNNNNNSGVIPDVASNIQSGMDNIEDRIESGTEGLLGMDRDESDDMDLSRDYDLSRDLDLSGDMSGNADLSRPLTEASDLTDESIAAAMTTDFSEIGGLDGTPDNGFPGGPVDDLNRPSGPMGYQARYGKYNAQFIVPSSKKIYLTFDEGYENGYTSKILDVLKEKNVKACFFITYPYAKTETALVRRMVAEGHTLGNHSTAHKNFPSMPLAEAAKDIMKLHEFVKANYGYEMTLFRPPEGSFSEQTLALAQSLGYTTVLWSFAYQDYDVNNQPISVEALDKLVSKAHPGAIYLLHAVSRTNTEILGQAIDKLKEQGYTFADYFGFS